MVDDRRVHEHEDLLTPGRAAVVNELEWLFGEPLRQFLGVRDRGRRANKDRVRAVMPADPAQPPQHVTKVTSEHAPIRMQLVDDDVSQILEQFGPARVVRQDPGVQHVGIAEDDVRPRANAAPRVLRRVAVVREDADGRGQVSARLMAETCPRDRLAHRVELGELILRERFGGKQVQRATRRILQDRVKDRRVIAERLPGCRGRDDHDVTPRKGVIDCVRLVRVEL